MICVEEGDCNDNDPNSTLAIKIQEVAGAEMELTMIVTETRINNFV